MSDAHPSIGGIPLAFGGNVFGWTIDRDQSFVILDAVYEAGIRTIDTAEGYSSWVPGNKGGESEAILGEWMESRGVRKDMLIGTKTGMGGPPNALKPENVAKALEGSLERLRTDYVDLYYAHRDDLTTPLDEVVSAYDEAFRSGKARELGASNYTAERLAEIVATAERMNAQPFTVVQPKYNLVWRQEFEGPLQDLCLAKGIVALPYYGLASGFLSGKYRSASDWEGTNRAFALAEFAENGGWDMLSVMDEIAGETGATLAQIALAWLKSQPAIAAPLASATTTEQLDQLVKAVTMALSPDQISRLNRGGRS
ncbi:MAG: aldo/keto reductase [Novosphingobium sp.]|nr:aldo/keto reductase [Novosphingobium sp.]MCP5404240.1 aldo/keto reductase [Novosphingobium sp.]